MEFFASLYEWWGLLSFYSPALSEHLRGWDITCSDFSGTPWYTYIAFISFTLTALVYAVFYHIIDSPRIAKRQHWFIFLVIAVLLSFLVAFSIPYNDVQNDNYCPQNTISIADCIGFGISNAIWTAIFFTIISILPYPRLLSTNCRHTPWKQ